MKRMTKMTKINPLIKMEQAYENGDASITLHGIIDPSYFWGDISLKSIKRELDGENFTRLNIYINSYGGDVFESIAISNYLSNLDAEVVLYVDGIAASGATVIAMAADKIIMPRNTMMMIHNAWTFANGNAEELRKVADDIEKISSSAAKTYESRFKGTPEELSKLMDEETMLSADECLALGFADEVIEVKSNKDDSSNQSVKNELLNKYVASGNKPQKAATNVFENLLKMTGKEV